MPYSYEARALFTRVRRRRILGSLCRSRRGWRLGNFGLPRGLLPLAVLFIIKRHPIKEPQLQQVGRACIEHHRPESPPVGRHERSREEHCRRGVECLRKVPPSLGRPQLLSEHAARRPRAIILRSGKDYGVGSEPCGNKRTLLPALVPER